MKSWHKVLIYHHYFLLFEMILLFKEIPKYQIKLPKLPRKIETINKFEITAIIPNKRRIKF